VTWVCHLGPCTPLSSSPCCLLQSPIHTEDLGARDFGSHRLTHESQALQSGHNSPKPRVHSRKSTRTGSSRTTEEGERSEFGVLVTDTTPGSRALVASCATHRLCLLRPQISPVSTVLCLVLRNQSVFLRPGILGKHHQSIRSHISLPGFLPRVRSGFGPQRSPGDFCWLGNFRGRKPNR